MTQKMTKALVGGARWVFVCLTSVRSLAADKAAVISHFIPGSGVWNPEGSLCASCHLLGRGGLSWGFTVEGLIPLPLGKPCTCLLRI